MIKPTNVESLTHFQKNAKEVLGRLEATKEPMVLTVNGKARLVVQDAEAYERMAGDAYKAQFIKAIQVALEESEAGLGVPAEKAFQEMKACHGL